jgi:threonyl-tRNA synthetase
MDLCSALNKQFGYHNFRPSEGGIINGKIQRAEQVKVQIIFVTGKRDLEADAVSVRVHGKENLGARPRSEAIADILWSIKERRP